MAENPKPDPQYLLIGAPLTGKTALMESIIKKAQSEGKTVHVYRPSEEIKIPMTLSAFPIPLLTPPERYIARLTAKSAKKAKKERLKKR